jgi:hypothetical protein
MWRARRARERAPYRYTAARMCRVRSWRAAVLVVAAVVASACAAPPEKELSTAAGALDAARAAGAAEFAPEALARAEHTLTRANAAVAERDYRSALSHALEAHLQAQAAARAAAEGRVKARVEADARLDAFATRIDDVETLLAAPEAKRVPAAARRQAQRAVARALQVLPEARAALERGELAEPAALGDAAAALDAAATGLVPPPSRRPRRR